MTNATFLLPPPSLPQVNPPAAAACPPVALSHPARPVRGQIPAEVAMQAHSRLAHPTQLKVAFRSVSQAILGRDELRSPLRQSIFQSTAICPAEMPLMPELGDLNRRLHIIS